LASFYQLLIEIGTEEFENFEHRAKDETQSPGEAATIKAFDFKKAGGHKIPGKKFNFIDVLPPALNNAAIAMSMGNFAQAADTPAEGIAKARDDARKTFQIGLSLYEAFEWIYGPDNVIDGFVLGVLRLREVPGAILPSDKIAEMAKDALAVWRASTA
jgi:hypothetical protein